MAIRFYILPIEQITTPPDEFGQTAILRGPKYFPGDFDPDPPALINTPFAMKDYGLIDAALLAADLTQAQHNALSSELDVAAAPANIDQNISDIAIPKIQAVMEALRIPAGWVNNTFTYRQILRMIGGLFLFAQRYHAMHNEQLIDNQGQLDLRWNKIPSARRGRILATADELGYDYAVITNTWTIRRILKHLSDQWGATPILFGSFGEL